MHPWSSRPDPQNYISLERCTPMIPHCAWIEEDHQMFKDVTNHTVNLRLAWDKMRPSLEVRYDPLFFCRYVVLEINLVSQLCMGFTIGFELLRQGFITQVGWNSVCSWCYSCRWPWPLGPPASCLVNYRCIPLSPSPLEAGSPWTI